MRLRSLALSLVALAIAACRGDTSGPTSSSAATRAADRFRYLADSSAAVGDSSGAQLFAVAADAVRAGGDVTTLPIVIDGASSDFSAIAFQLNLPATTTCDELGCREEGPFQEHVLVAWQEAPSDRIVVIAKDGPGARPVALDTTVLDTTALYTITTPPAGFALVGAEAGAGWYSTGGTASDALVSTGGACPPPREQTPGVAFTCTQAMFNWSADFTAAEALIDAPGATHRIVIAGANVPGARVEVSAMSGSVSAMLGRAPVRSRLLFRVEKGRGGP